MSDRTIRAIAVVVWEEIARNPDFAGRVENALGNFAVEFKKRRDDENKASGISLAALIQEGGVELLRKKLGALRVSALRLVVERNNVDPGGVLGAKANKAELIEAITKSVERKWARKGAFDY